MVIKLSNADKMLKDQTNEWNDGNWQNLVHPWRWPLV